MYRKVPEFKRYTSREILFITGLSIVIFVIGCTLVGYGVYVTEIMPWSDNPISYFLRGNYLQAVWIIGVICIVAGLLGFASVIRSTTFKLLKRRR